METKTYNLDLRGLTPAECDTAIRLAATHLQVDAGELFTELSLSAFAYIQTRTIMGQNVILTLGIRGAFSGEGHTMSPGSTLYGRMLVYTPDNNCGSTATGIMLYNHTFDNFFEALNVFTRMEYNMEVEAGVYLEE